MFDFTVMQAREQDESIVEDKYPVFHLIYNPYLLIELDRSIRIVYHKHITIAFIIISSPIPGIQNWTCKSYLRFLFD